MDVLGMPSVTLLGDFVSVSDTFPETNSSPLRIVGWKTILSFWEGLFSGANC